MIHPLNHRLPSLSKSFKIFVTMKECPNRQLSRPHPMSSPLCFISCSALEKSLAQLPIVPAEQSSFAAAIHRSGTNERTARSLVYLLTLPLPNSYWQIKSH
jgi:hypothetical protein